ncbi:MAG: HAD family hydrolase [Thermoplasmata archaeon]|nr:MAG: HAD family hydrolase [Thermoplasmata archaeon]
MERFKGYVLDLDGTIYRGPYLMPGAREVVAELRKRGCKIVFLSNKAIQTRVDYAEKLTRLGIPATPEDVINSSLVTVDYLRREQPDARLYIIGEPPLIKEALNAGLRLARQPEETDIVVVSFDRTFHYGKLRFAYNAIMKGARIIATNADRTCPVEGGEELPDAASIIAALKALTDKEPELILGKPSPRVLEMATSRMGLKPSECLMVGDRLETDIVMGKAAGMKTALVLTGVTRREQLEASDVKPDYVLDSVAELIEGA